MKHVKKFQNKNILRKLFKTQKPIIQQFVIHFSPNFWFFVLLCKIVFDLLESLSHLTTFAASKLFIICNLTIFSSFISAPYDFDLADIALEFWRLKAEFGLEIDGGLCSKLYSFLLTVLRFLTNAWCSLFSWAILSKEYLGFADTSRPSMAYFYF